MYSRLSTSQSTSSLQIPTPPNTPRISLKMNSYSRSGGLPSEEYHRLQIRYVLESHFGVGHGRKPRLENVRRQPYAMGVGSHANANREATVKNSAMAYATRKALGESFDFNEESYQRLNGGRSSKYQPMRREIYGSVREKDNAVRKTLALLPENNAFTDSMRYAHRREENMHPILSNMHNGKRPAMLRPTNYWRQTHDPVGTSDYRRKQWRQPDGSTNTYDHHQNHRSHYPSSSASGTSTRVDSAYVPSIHYEPEPPSKFSWDSDSDDEHVARKKKEKKKFKCKYWKKKLLG